MFPSFVPNKARPLCARPYLVPSIYLACIAASLLPPGGFRALTGTAALIYLIAQVPKYTDGQVAVDNLLPIQSVLVLLHWIDFFILHSPDEFYRVEDRGRKTEQTFARRLRLNFDLCTSMRGIGWNWQVKNVPAAKNKMPRWTFVRHGIFRAVRSYLLYDLCRIPAGFTLYGSATPPDLLSDTIMMQIIFGWLVCIGSYGSLNMQYSLFAALAVAIGIYEPKDWPPITGGLETFTTIREVWGKFWHQLLRRKLNLPFRVLARYIPIRRGTLTSRYLQLYLAFIASALIHHLGSLNVTSSTAENNWNSLVFFLIQPLAITFEDFAIYLGKTAGIKSSWKTKCLRTLCTVAWFSYSFRYFSAFCYNSGMLANSPMPSLLKGILGLINKASGSLT